MKKEKFDKKFYNQDGSLNKYSFACGYIEKVRIMSIYKEIGYYASFYIDACLYQSGGVYHIFVFKDKEGKIYPGDKLTNRGGEILFEKSYDYLTEARKVFYSKLKEFCCISKSDYLKNVITRECRGVK